MVFTHPLPEQSIECVDASGQPHLVHVFKRTELVYEGDSAASHLSTGWVWRLDCGTPVQYLDCATFQGVATGKRYLRIGTCSH